MFHDLGKANYGFQDTLRHRGQQAICYEHLSALLLYLELNPRIGCVETVRLGSTLKLSYRLLFLTMWRSMTKNLRKRLLPGVDNFQCVDPRRRFRQMPPTRRTDRRCPHPLICLLIIGCGRSSTTFIDGKDLLGIWVVHCITSNANSKKVHNDTRSSSCERQGLLLLTRQARR